MIQIVFTEHLSGVVTVAVIWYTAAPGIEEFGGLVERISTAQALRFCFARE